MDHFSTLGKSAARSALKKAARAAISEALASGAWLAASDACLDKSGCASAAWAVFDPSGRLAASGSARLELSQARSTTQAEAWGAALAAEALDALGASKAVCLCDCAPAVDRLGEGAASEPATIRFLAASRGRFSPRWVGRDSLGPANDLARRELGLRPEQAFERTWADWAARMLPEPPPALRSSRSAGA
jgi:hypothetical protein